MPAKPKKIAVIGGGVGAITSVYAITQLPNWQDEYDITLYQLGWRLGGKGASGRNMKNGGRIEEHGLHIWAGFYENGFRLMRDCYEQLNITGLREPGAPLGTLEKSFEGLDSFLLAEEITKDGKTTTHPWRITFPPNSDQPGTGNTVLPTPFAYFQMFLEVIENLLETLIDGIEGDLEQAAPPRFHAGLKRHNVAIKHKSPLHQLRALAKALPKNAFDHSHSQHMLLADLSRHTQGWYKDQGFTPEILSDELRRITYMVDLSLAFFRGMIDCGLFRRGFDAIDDTEISQWLLNYGASKEAVYSAVFRGCYDYVFGYPGAVTDGNRDVGAGTAIRGLLRLAFGYKGSLFFKMMAGMGDTIFGPYYQVLKHRGVKFKFFNALTNLGLDDTNSYVERLDMVEQAKPLTDYDPLVDVQGLPCWPSEPLWDQLQDGKKLAKDGVDFECEKDAPTGRAYSLTKGTDFDEVILGASLGSMPYMAQELIAASNRWQAMIDNVGTVATHAAQFWLSKTAEEMGWNGVVAAHNPGKIPNDLKTVITSFQEPLDTWADMSDLIGREDWETPPKSIAYFCSPASDYDPDAPKFQDEVRDWTDTWLTQLWPDAEKDGKFDMSLLHDVKGGDGDERFRAQYFRENFWGSERYVLSKTGSVKYRLAPDDSGFENLYLAGDWTRCGINAGCVEAATISGLAAARGLTGADIDIVGEGDLAPDAGPTDAPKLASPYAQSANWPLTPFFGVGKLDGFFSFHAVDRQELEKCLPPGMSLHPQAITPEGTHPVSILANQQMGVRPTIMPKILGFRDYFEAIVAINYVQVDGHEGTFAHLPNLYLNSWLPKMAGVWFYGYNKRLGQLSMGHNSYSVKSQTGQQIWSGKYAQRDLARPLSDYQTFGAVHRLADQVVVTKNKLGKWQFSNLDFGLSAAYGAGIHARIDVQDANLANLPAGEMVAQPLRLNNDQASENLALPGAFRIWSSWTLSNPFDSGRIARLESERTRL